MISWQWQRWRCWQRGYMVAIYTHKMTCKYFRHPYIIYIIWTLQIAQQNLILKKKKIVYQCMRQGLNCSLQSIFEPKKRESILNLIYFAQRQVNCNLQTELQALVEMGSSFWAYSSRSPHFSGNGLRWFGFLQPNLVLQASSPSTFNVRKKKK